MMEYALAEAFIGFHKGEVPVGAVVVDSRTRKIVAKAHNEMESQQDPTAHAELLAIQKACRVLGVKRLSFCDVYVTLEPCPMCAQALSFAHIRQIFFGAYDPKGGGVDHGPRLFQSSSCPHRPEVFGGILESVCGEVIKDFFNILR